MKKSELITAFCRAQLGEPYDLGDHGPDRCDRNRMEEQHGN